jgi:hypothetical protein
MPVGSNLPFVPPGLFTGLIEFEVIVSSNIQAVCTAVFWDLGVELLAARLGETGALGNRPGD